MQYQYEMIPNTLLSQLSEKIQQKPLYEKDAFIHKIELQSIPDIPIFFQNLELLIYLMVNVNENEVQKLKENKISSFIENLPQNFKIDDSFIDYCKRQEILVKNLVSFFEIVELFTYYRKILEKLSSDYQEELSKKEIEDLEKFCLYLSNENNDNKIILNQSNVADAIRRYICRNLIGSNLSSTHKLGDFLGVDNLWPEKIFIESEKVLVMFPESITFKFAVAAQKFLRTKDEVELIEKKANNLQKKNEKKQVAQPIKQVPKIGVNRKR